MFLLQSVDIAGVIACARHEQNPDLLKATFPDLTDEMALSIVEGLAIVEVEGKRLIYRRVSNVH